MLLARSRTPLLLYSTNTWLAYIIAHRYYNDRHFAWCTPYFDSNGLPSLSLVLPPTSSPSEIYKTLSREVSVGDRHSPKIAQNKIGILNGANVKRISGIITAKEYKEIAAAVAAAQASDFKPLLFVIPYLNVRRSAKPVSVANKAHPLSEEYIIENLSGRFFDIIEF